MKLSRPLVDHARCALGVLFALTASTSWGAYSCTVSGTGVGALYTGGNVDANGTVVLTCNRDVADANTLTYRLKADNGANAQAAAPYRRLRLDATANYLNYIVRRGTAVGGAAVCGNTTTWQAPATGATNVITGTISFGTALSASVTWGYCVRIRGTPGGNPASPVAGLYTDVFNVFAQYPNSDAGALTPSVALNYSSGASNQCIFNTYPSAMAFTYSSFSAAPQSVVRTFDLQCSNGLAWALNVSPASNTLLGLNYTVGVSPASSTGTGADQVITLTGTMPAGQAGTCATATCAGTQVHVLTITY